MATRAPSCASFTAIPRPIPRAPPVINATRFRSDIRLPEEAKVKKNQYSLAAQQSNRTRAFFFSRSHITPENLVLGKLTKTGNHHGHVVGLFGRPSPLLCSSHQRFGNDAWRRTLHVHCGLLQPANAELFSVEIFRPKPAVTSTA